MSSTAAAFSSHTLKLVSFIIGGGKAKTGEGHHDHDLEESACIAKYRSNSLCAMPAITSAKNRCMYQTW